MRSRIVRLALVAAAAALVLFGLPLGAAAYAFSVAEERASLQRLADFAALSVQEDLTHDRSPDRLPEGPDGEKVALYDDQGSLLQGEGPTRGDGPVQRALDRGLPARPPDDLVVAAPVSDTHQVVGVVRVAAPAGAVTRTLVPVSLATAALAGLVLLAVWFLARRLALRLSRPMQQIAIDADRLGDGDFGIRPRPTEIGEVDLIGSALGRTAQRLDDLLARERAFSAEASHQLRTPLAGLRLRLESTLDRPDRLTRATIEDGLASIDRLERTVDELLLLAREQRAAAVPADLDRLMTEARDEWSDRLAHAGRGFTAYRPEDLSDPAASAAAVRQIVAVLLDNAAQHGAGSVALTARDAGPDVIAVDVADEGPGVPDGVLDDRDGSRGIGLSLARRLAESDGGRLTVSDHRPATVTVLLPARRPVASAGPSAVGAPH